MNNWLDPSEIEIVQFSNAEAIEEYQDAIDTMIQLSPDDHDGYVDSIKDYPEALTLALVNNEPVGYIQILDKAAFKELGKDSLMFGGGVVPEYRNRGIMQQCAPYVIQRAFEDSGKTKMLAFIDPTNRPARMAIISLGFKPFGLHNGECRYILKRSDLA